MARRLLLTLIGGGGIAFLAAAAFASATQRANADQRDVPLEVEPADSSLAKIVLVAGRQSHGPGEHEFFAGCALLMDLLKQTPGVCPVMARDGWPKKEETFKGAKSVVFFMDGGGGHPIIQDGHLAEVQKLIDSGAGF